MNEGKAKVIGSVLKFKGAFKAIDVVNDTGLTRQLVAHHLRTLLNDGYLEKDNVHWLLVARNDLIDSLSNLNATSATGLLEEQPIYLISKEQLNLVAETMVLLLSAEMPGAYTNKQKVVQKIDESVNALKGLKRYINSKRMAERKAIKKVWEQQDELWSKIGKQSEVDKEDWFRALGEKFDALKDEKL